MSKIEVVIVNSGIKLSSITMDELLSQLKHKYESTIWDLVTERNIQYDLDHIYNLFGKKLKYKIEGSSVIIYPDVKLIYDDKELDSSKEHEIIHEEGMTVEIHYSKSSHFCPKISLWENITEVHFMFSSEIVEPQVAFESNILKTGFTRFITDIDLIKITIT